MIVVFSDKFYFDLTEVFDFGVKTFGLSASEEYIENIYEITATLESTYKMYPECRWIPTKERIYRNIILDSYLIIYRISAKVEVLRIIRATRSITKIKEARKITIG